MLRISQKDEIENFDIDLYRSYRIAKVGRQGRTQLRILLGLTFVLFLMLFLPWTQNTRARGKLNALRPESRPQTIHSIIPGRIEKWYVGEGDFVKKGDTILYLSEIRDNFMDPRLLDRTQLQIDAKVLSVGAYGRKVEALEKQIEALTTNRRLRIKQAENRLRQAELRVESDSIDFEAAKVNFQIAERQFARSQKLFEDGLVSMTDLETRENQFEAQKVRIIGAENKLLDSKNELLTAQIELNAVDFDFQDKVAKAESDKFTAMSNQFEAEVSVNALENRYSNFAVRAGNYYILAPQDGYITQAQQVGIGETIGEGAPILSILPADHELAAEIFIEPLDLPLVKKGNKVRFIFDGWPAIVFSGWPQLSNGTFGGVVYAVDNFTSSNNMYRVLVVPDPEEQPWPEPLRIGTGAEGILLFNDVPVWYEIWRQLNGFPPDFYDLNLSVSTSNSKSK
ncbi:MAG: HlyD family secretion protein [Cyclobacteriaceae bacterium]|nr:HlyD family efflux transporter periplasmic adaptor subunit [Cyclobacteriaceae bacterium]MCH8516019.1 HlyD family secretion protein [Cyclobacteriaceae bacterium]